MAFILHSFTPYFRIHTGANGWIFILFILVLFSEVTCRLYVMAMIQSSKFGAEPEQYTERTPICRRDSGKGDVEVSAG